jgi:sulfite exporter TauE/SafE
MDGFLQLTLAAAFLAGIAGGAHCAAMCGPLIGIACGPCARGRGREWLFQALAYNAGRIATYVAAGALTGFVGAAGLTLRGAPLTQQALLFAMGVSLLLLATYVAGVAPFVRGVERAGAVVWRYIGPRARAFLPVNTPARAFGLGLIFGWLPCGMVYVALVAALTTADPLYGGMVMAAFGLGTLPNVLAISAWFKYLAAAAQGRLARVLIAAVIAAMGLFGVLKASYPHAVAAGGQWCLEIPGIAGLLGGGGV